jgi:hypothetical protein
MNLWYTNFASQYLKNVARVPNLGVAENGGLPDPAFASWNQAGSISSPTSTPAGLTTAGIVFPLSTSEVNNFMPNLADRYCDNRATAIGTEPPGADWWTRSPGQDTMVPYGCGVARIRENGTIYYQYDWRGQPYYYYFRPAMWIQT